jgi:hypothetical protein
MSQVPRRLSLAACLDLLVDYPVITLKRLAGRLEASKPQALDISKALDALADKPDATKSGIVNDALAAWVAQNWSQCPEIGAPTGGK